MAHAARRVVISGMGWVTPLGIDLDLVWQSLLRSQCAIDVLTRFDASTFATNFAAEVKDFDVSAHIPTLKGNESWSVGSQYALVAAQRAMHEAGIDRLDRHADPRRVGMYLGAGEGPPDVNLTGLAAFHSWSTLTKSLSDQKWATMMMERNSVEIDGEQEPFLALNRLSKFFGCRGPAYNCMTACAAGTQAVGEAFEIIKRGDADMMLAGGTHSMIHPLGMTGFIRLTAMSTRRDDPRTASRPFDVTRDGFVMGEGAGVVVLEELEHAKRRGAKFMCEVAGYGSSADAFRITDIQEEGKGAQAAMLQACTQAGINPREPDAHGRPQVHYISAHGTGTKENDRIETMAVKGVFGSLAPKIPFSSVKSMLGHLIQAAGAVELITCVMAIRSGWVPPTINLHSPDPECDLDHVPNVARDLNHSGGVHTCLSNSFGFGGQNNALVVKRFVE